LFIDSITAAKKIKALTGISENPVSVSSISIKFLEQRLNIFSDKKALVIGLGEMSRIAVKNLLSRNISKLFVTNRTRRKLTDFAGEFPDIIEVDFKDRYKFIDEVDIIISCTAAPHFVIFKDKFEKYYKNQPLYILDLAIPRDIDPEIQKILGIEIFRVDDLEKIAQENIEKRQHAKVLGLTIIEEGMRKYNAWIDETKVANLILNINEHSKKIMSKELYQLKSKLCMEVSEVNIAIIEKAFNSFVKAFTHEPIIRLKELVRDNQDADEILKKVFDYREGFNEQVLSCNDRHN
jgi:glutamyl-tRNA reductase